jgi:hypothetical protein
MHLRAVAKARLDFPVQLDFELGCELHRKFGQFDYKTTPDSLKTNLCLQTFVDKIELGESQVHLSARQMSDDNIMVVWRQSGTVLDFLGV